MPKFSANLTVLFTEVELPERYAAAAGAGFKGVEMLFPYGYDARLMAERRAAAAVEQVMFNLPPGDWAGGERGITALPGREGEFQEGLGLAVEYAKALGCARLHAMAGIVGDDLSPEAALRSYHDNLRFAAEVCAREGIALMIEPINNRDMPGYWLNTTAQALQVIKEVGHANLFLQYDVYHAQVMEGRLSATLSENLAQIRHIQISSFPGRHEPDDGEINYPFLFRHLDEIGYEGWVGCEYNPRGTTTEGLGWAAPYGIAAS